MLVIPISASMLRRHRAVMNDQNIDQYMIDLLTRPWAHTTVIIAAQAVEWAGHLKLPICTPSQPR